MRELLGGTEEKSIFRNKGSLICPLIIFYKKETEKQLSQWPDLGVGFTRPQGDHFLAGVFDEQMLPVQKLHFPHSEAADLVKVRSGHQLNQGLLEISAILQLHNQSLHH